MRQISGSQCIPMACFVATGSRPLGLRVAKICNNTGMEGPIGPSGRALSLPVAGPPELLLLGVPFKSFCLTGDLN